MNTLTRLLTAAGLGMAVLAGATATATAAPTSTAPTSTTPTAAAATEATAAAGLAQVQTLLPASQIQQLRDHAPADTAQADRGQTAGIGIMAQGGFDRDHWWVKISMAEIVSVGANVACRAVFRAAAGVVCPPIVAAVNWLVARFPHAGGFWAELYTNGQVRAGTW